MIFYSTRRFFPAAVAACTLLAALLEAASQSVVSAGNDRISIHAKSVPLATFFDELSEIVPVEVLVLAPDVQNVSVSLELAEVHPVFGVHKFLEKAEVDYAVSGGDGEPFRILVGTLGDADLGSMGRSSSSVSSQGVEETYAEDVEAEYGMDREVELGSNPEEEGFTQEPEAANRVTGMAGSGLAGAGGQRRTITGMASPGASEGSLLPGAPGGVVPPPMVPPQPPEAPEGETAAPLPRGPRPSPVTGGGFVTGSAGLSQGPAHRRVAATGGVLLMGLSLGLFLVRRNEA